MTPLEIIFDAINQEIPGDDPKKRLAAERAIRELLAAGFPLREPPKALSERQIVSLLGADLAAHFNEIDTRMVTMAKRLLAGHLLTRRAAPKTPLAT